MPTGGFVLLREKDPVPWSQSGYYGEGRV